MVEYCPDNIQVIKRRSKELHILKSIQDVYNDHTIISNKMIPNTCKHKYRPDILMDLGYIVIVVEVDEDQHHTYPSSCELARETYIHETLNYRKVLFIRFNPDGLTFDSGRKYQTMINVSDKGIVKNGRNFKSRIQALFDEINKNLEDDMRYDSLFNKIYLWYNGSNTAGLGGQHKPDE